MNLPTNFKYLTINIVQILANKITLIQKLTNTTMELILSTTMIYIAVTTLFIVALLSFFLNKTKSPPSPLALPILGHLHLLSIKEPLHHTVNRMHDRLGPILSLRFGNRKVIVVAKGALAEESLLSHGVVFANRPQFPSLRDFSYNFTVLGTSNYGDHWRNMRKLASSELLAPHSLNLSTDVRTSELQSLVRTLFQEANVDGDFTKVEMKSKFLTVILNDIMRMMAAKMFSEKEQSSESNEEEVFRDWVEDVFSILGGRTNIADYLPFLGWLNLNGWKKKVASIAEYRDEFFQKLLDDIRRSSTDEQKRKTIMATMLALQKTDPKYYTDEIIKGFAITMLTAGTDTSSNTIEWALTLLLNNPDKLEKLQAEIDEKIGSDRLVQESDVQNLPYLQCVINETLRLKPAGPMMVPHEASENCVVGGYKIPKGTMLLVNAYRIHRDPDTWVEPLKFEPERFQSGKHDVSKMLIFGMGRMRCPGEVLARRMVGSVLGSVVQCFDWKRVGDEAIDMTESVAITMGKEIPLEALYRPRENMKGVVMKL